MKQPKEGPQWDDRVAITIMLGVWLAMGLIGLWTHGGSYVTFLLG